MRSNGGNDSANGAKWFSLCGRSRTTRLDEKLWHSKFFAENYRLLGGPTFDSRKVSRQICVCCLKASGCIAVSGGLEVASDRLLKLIDKGVTVEQVAKVTRNFTKAGIMVHAYLMYGYPTQTVQETVDSLEMVRQLFEAGVLQSGFWHQFAMTAHSPVGMNPEQYGAVPIFPPLEGLGWFLPTTILISRIQQESTTTNSVLD